MKTTTGSAAAARAALLDVLVDDQVDTYLSDSGCRAQLRQRFLEGFKGFETMSNAELLQCASDAGLDERHAELCAQIEGASDDAAGQAVRETVLQFTVLHDDDSDLVSRPLGDLAYECADGSYVGGGLTVVSTRKLTPDELSRAAAALGSDASFFAPDSAK